MRPVTALSDTDSCGELVVKLADLCNEKGISRMKLSRLADTDYRAIKRLFDGDIERFDAKILVRICYALECELCDILEYQSPEQIKDNQNRQA